MPIESSRQPLTPSARQRELLRKITELVAVSGESNQGTARLENLSTLASRHSVYGTSPTSPVREILHLVGDKWSSLILCILKTGRCRYSALRSLVSLLSHESTISHRVLTSKLRLLERDGLITRHVFPTIPPRVEYESSQFGRSLTDIIEQLFSWAETNYEAILAARRGFDESAAEDAPDGDR